MSLSTTKIPMILLLLVTAVHGYPYYYQNSEEVNPFNSDFNSLNNNWINEIINSIITSSNPNSENYDLQVDPYEDTDDSIEETEEYVEDDIIIPLTKTRSGLRDISTRWPGGVIPYKINSHFSAEEKIQIKKAMDEFHKNTCIRFTPHKGKEGDFVRIRPSEQRCNSDIGRKGGRQDLNLSAQCTKIKGKIIHELMHIVGFHHEQSRTDRDNYVEIKWENIRSGEERNFRKYNSAQVNDFDVSYDYDSIMHYPSLAFSSNKQPTIVIKGNQDVKIGQRERLSVKDIQKIRQMYNCQ